MERDQFYELVERGRIVGLGGREKVRRLILQAPARRGGGAGEVPPVVYLHRARAAQRDVQKVRFTGLGARYEFGGVYFEFRKGAKAYDHAK